MSPRPGGPTASSRLAGVGFTPRALPPFQRAGRRPHLQQDLPLLGHRPLRLLRGPSQLLGDPPCLLAVSPRRLAVSTQHLVGLPKPLLLAPESLGRFPHLFVQPTH